MNKASTLPETPRDDGADCGEKGLGRAGANTDDRWASPTAVDDLMLAFGAHPITKYLPTWEETPEAIRRYWHTHLRTTWPGMVSAWFFDSLPALTEMEPKEGIDARAAVRHIAAVMKSRAPKHEEKIAGCAYLLSRWFDRFGGARSPSAGNSA